MPRSVAELLPFIPPATASQTGLATADQIATIERLELAAGDGDTINEGTDFSAGATYTVDPADARDRWLKVLGAADGPLTANMIVDLNVAAGGWAGQQGIAVGMVRKADSSTFTVTVTGFDTSGTGTRVLERHHDFVLWRLITTDSANGPGPGGSKFDDMVRIRRANSTQIAQATDTERLVTPASLAPLVAAQLVPSGTLRITGFTLTAGVQDAISSSGGTFVITFPAGAAAPVGCRVGLYLKDITNPVTFAVTDGSTVDGFNLAVDTYSLDGPDDSALAWRRESSSAWVYDGLTGVLSSGGGGGGGTIPVQDEGVEVLAAPTALDFRGAGVTTTNVGGVARVTIPGDGGTPLATDIFIASDANVAVTAPGARSGVLFNQSLTLTANRNVDIAISAGWGRIYHIWHQAAGGFIINPRYENPSSPGNYIGILAAPMVVGEIAIIAIRGDGISEIIYHGRETANNARSSIIAASLGSGAVTCNLANGSKFAVTIAGSWNAATPLVGSNPPASGVSQTIELVATISGTQTVDLAGLPWLGGVPFLDIASGAKIVMIATWEGSTLVDVTAANRA